MLPSVLPMASPAISTRSALRELRHTPVTPVRPENNLNTSDPSPTPSPEEQVIQQRGRRKVSHVNISANNLLLTPPKVVRSPKKMHLPSTPTRSSPRKRLNMNPVDINLATPPPTPCSVKSSKIPKLMKLQRKLNQNNLLAALKALSASQLVDVVTEVAKRHPNLKEDLLSIIPSPDLGPLEERLCYLQKNIFKSIPNSRWGSKTDSFCYRRVSTHIEAFKKECVSQGQQLIESEQWPFVVEYVLMAMSYVKGLPNWDNPAHNKSKQQCYKNISTQLLSALKKDLSPDLTQLLNIQQRLQEYSEYSDSVNSCLKYIDGIINKASK